MDIILPVSRFLGILVFAAQICLVGALAYYLLSSKDRRSEIAAKFGQNGIRLAFAVALVATLGSLFYSQIAKFAPCELCWYQRIFMYPQVILLGLALLKKESRIIDYSLALSGVGTLISLYHNYIFYGGAPVTSCGISAEASASCTQKYIVELGYITIPLMALTAFLSIIALLTVQKIYGKNKNN